MLIILNLYSGLISVNLSQFNFKPTTRKGSDIRMYSMAMKCDKYLSDKKHLQTLNTIRIKEMSKFILCDRVPRDILWVFMALEMI